MLGPEMGCQREDDQQERVRIKTLKQPGNQIQVGFADQRGPGFRLGAVGCLTLTHANLGCSSNSIIDTDAGLREGDPAEKDVTVRPGKLNVRQFHADGLRRVGAERVSSRIRQSTERQ